MSAEGGYDEFIVDVLKHAHELVKSAEDGWEETFTGVPYQSETLNDVEFVTWVEQTAAKDPNWFAFLPLTDDGEGRRTLERYMRCRMRGVPSMYVQPEPVAVVPEVF